MISHSRAEGNQPMRPRGRRNPFVAANTGPHRSGGGLWVSPMSAALKGPVVYRARVRDLAVAVEAIMTSTAATAIAMIQRTQSMPGLPLPPNAV
jgi:hypothetical protein